MSHHIDHIIPLSWAKSEKEALALSHYSNLQLLLPIDNLTKGNRDVSGCDIIRVISNHPTPEVLIHVVNKSKNVN